MSIGERFRACFRRTGSARRSPGRIDFPVASALAQMIRTEVAKWRKVVESAKIRVG